MPGHLAAALAGPLQQTVICAEGHARTVWLDADGNEHPAPQDCRDCPVCHSPLLVSGSEPVLPGRPVRWTRPAVTADAAQVRGAIRPLLVLTRGPPSFSSVWTHAVPSPAGDSLWSDAGDPRQPKRRAQAIAMDARA
ncbi:hypothetical protein ACDP63_19145 [Paracoccus sp. P2]|nr:hypothetical protein [Paracoccus pantotrophus]MDF3853904.1 hypothetical protein [Paracoccus pantotrophus]RDD96769.1 hypothetical protein DTW92_11095 [Paracoccus pantotrophus]RNI16657.1 hypothetical protein EB844_12315 [Paracoccus pantotrophus]WGR67355.1 hypothetical protein E3U24_19205 [Paracoccus pantotrophus]